METPQPPRSGGGSLQKAWRQKGFYRSVLLFALASLLACIVNVSFTVWATVNHEVTAGLGILAENSCKETGKLSAILHVVINFISTILFAGSNYCMQCLSAPTRQQLDEAHKRRRWMDIGVSSLRNVFPAKDHHSIGVRRTMLWLILGLSSLPLHLL